MCVCVCVCVCVCECVSVCECECVCMCVSVCKNMNIHIHGVKYNMSCSQHHQWLCLASEDRAQTVLAQSASSSAQDQSPYALPGTG